MPTFTAFTTHADPIAAEALGAALERLMPEPTGVGVFEIEDGSGLWEIGGYFAEAARTRSGWRCWRRAFGAKPFVGVGTAGNRLGREGAPRAGAGRGGAVLRLRQP